MHFYLLSREDAKDEPWAWEAREFLRNMLVGKEVLFVVDHTVPSSGRQYGTLFLGRDMETGVNVNEAIVAEGLASARREGKSDLGKLAEAEDAAKAAHKGKWGVDNDKHIRTVIWSVDNPRDFLEKHRRKPISAIVEHVRDGSTIRVFLLPSFQYITLMISGIRVS
jgi:staphylococcal nuclease domain-containing protein 1